MFDIIGAKKAGFTDPEIAQEMAKKFGFDYGSARKAGFTDQEVIGEMLSKSDAGTSDAKTPLMSSHAPNQRVIPEKSYIQRVADPENMKRYGQWLTSPAPGPQEGESAVGRMVQNIPESAFKLPYQALAGGYQLVKNVTDPLVEGAFGGENTLSNLGQGAMNTVDMVSRGFGEPIGLYGLDRAKERWVTDPVGSAASVAPFAPEAVRVTGVGRGAKAIVKGTGALADAVASRVGPEGLYNSALKMKTSEKVSIAERSKRAQTGLEGGYMPTENGYNRLVDDIDSVNQQIGESIKGAASSGKTIAVEDVLKRLEPIKERALNDINPQPILDTIAEIENNLRSHPKAINGAAPKQTFSEFTKGEMGQYTKEEGGHGAAMERLGREYADYKATPDITNAQIPIDVAQNMKIEIYRGLRKAYGEMKSAEVEARKAVGWGLKEEIVKMVPEISELNAKDSALLGLEKSLAQATKRILNRDVVGLGATTKMIAGGVGKMAGGFALDAAGGGGLFTSAAAAALIIDIPQVKSALAIAMYRARKAAGKASPMSKIKAEIAQMAKTAKEKAGSSLDGFGGLQLSPGKIGDQNPANLPVPSDTMRVTPEGQAVPGGPAGGSYGTAMTPQEIAASRRNVNQLGPMTKGFTLKGEPYNPDAVVPDQYIPPGRQVAIRQPPQPVDAQRPIAGYLTLQQLGLPEQTAAIAGERGAVYMPQNALQILNPREMTPREIAASKRKINAKGRKPKK